MSVPTEIKSANDIKIAVDFPESAEKLPSNTSLQESVPYLSMRPVFCFIHVAEKDKDYSHTVIKDHKTLKLIISKLKYLSNYTWLEIERKFHGGSLPWSAVKKDSFPIECPEDIPLYHFGLDDTFRIFGYFDRKSVFHVVWFDPFHKLIKKH